MKEVQDRDGISNWVERVERITSMQDTNSAAVFNNRRQNLTLFEKCQ